MKKIILIRHAKSSWDSPLFKDFDRPLNERGIHDLPIMVKRLVEHKVSIDAFLSSTALRAKTTANYFAKALSIPEKKIFFFDELYNAPLHIFYKVISQLDDSLETVAIFAHNPGITDMANSLEVAKLDEMPTCGMFGASAETKYWLGFQEAEKRFLMFDYPKREA